MYNGTLIIVVKKVIKGRMILMEALEKVNKKVKEGY
jgi:hypothetical protein